MTDTPAISAATQGRFEQVPLDNIRLHPRSRPHDPAKLAELRDSIKERGQLQRLPVAVLKMGSLTYTSAMDGTWLVKSLGCQHWMS